MRLYNVAAKFALLSLVLSVGTQWPSQVAGQASAPAPGPTSPTPLSVYQLAEATPELSILTAALEVAGLSEELSDPDLDITVFAPTDAAFEALLSTINVTADELFNSTELLTAVLAYHVVPQAAYSSELSDGLVLPTLLANETLMVDLSSQPGSVLIMPSSGGAAKVIMPDVPAGAGVVHIIDAVLLPASVVEESG